MRTKQHSVLESRGRSRYVNILASSQDELFRAVSMVGCLNIEITKTRRFSRAGAMTTATTVGVITL